MRKFLDQNRNFPIQLLEEKRIDFPIESAHYSSRFFFSIELFKYCGLVRMCKYTLLIIILQICRRRHFQAGIVTSPFNYLNKQELIDFELKCTLHFRFFFVIDLFIYCGLVRLCKHALLICHL